MKITQQQEANKHRRLGTTQVPRHMPACAVSSQKVMEDIFMSRSAQSLDQIIAEGFGCYLRARRRLLASHLYKSEYDVVQFTRRFFFFWISVNYLPDYGSGTRS